jgi:hypothetical protein
LLVLFAPALAAIEIFSDLDGVFSFGQLAAWLRDHWRPLTHSFWTWIFDHVINLNIVLTSAEKDSLTAAAFFAPLALTSFVQSRIGKGETSTLEDPETGVLHSNLIRSAAILFAIGILFLLSRQMVTDILSLIGSASKDYKIPPQMSLIAFGLLSIYAVFVFAGFFARSRISFWTRIARFVTTGVGLIEFLLLGAPFLVGVYIASIRLGEIRTFAIAIVILAMLETIAVAPRRIVTIAGWVVAFIAFSYLWDFWLYVRENADKMS